MPFSNYHRSNHPTPINWKQFVKYCFPVNTTATEHQQKLIPMKISGIWNDVINRWELFIFRKSSQVPMMNEMNFSYWRLKPFLNWPGPLSNYPTPVTLLCLGWSLAHAWHIDISKWWYWIGWWWWWRWSFNINEMDVYPNRGDNLSHGKYTEEICFWLIR